MRPVLLAAALAVGGLVGLAACSSSGSSSDPQITFSTSGSTVSASPIQYCDVQEKNCTSDGTAPAVVSVPAGATVQVKAPQSVSSTPWQVAARFHGSTGNEYVSCSPLFGAGKASQYTVSPAASGDTLVLIEVYQSSAVLQKNPDGVHTTPVRGTWVLTDKNGTSSVLPQPGDNLCDD
ncbi:MAG TPA: DUF2771 family protein [Pseudonocardiaceae bacterium]|nr:DUF2771 family protein [Pseudonocardiaceae bacterium]